MTAHIFVIRNQNPIRAARRLADLTQQQLGELLNVQKGSVCSWEKGRCRPDPERALQLVRLLPGLTMEQIYSHRSDQTEAA